RRQRRLDLGGAEMHQSGARTGGERGGDPGRHACVDQIVLWLGRGTNHEVPARRDRQREPAGWSLLQRRPVTRRSHADPIAHLSDPVPFAWPRWWLRVPLLSPESTPVRISPCAGSSTCSRWLGCCPSIACLSRW